AGVEGSGGLLKGVVDFPVKLPNAVAKLGNAATNVPYRIFTWSTGRPPKDVGIFPTIKTLPAGTPLYERFYSKNWFTYGGESYFVPPAHQALANKANKILDTLARDNRAPNETEVKMLKAFLENNAAKKEFLGNPKGDARAGL